MWLSVDNVLPLSEGDYWLLDGFISWVSSDGKWTLLAGIKSDAYAAEVASLRGQIAYRQGNMEVARTALEEAQEKGAKDEIIKYLLEELQEQS